MAVTLVGTAVVWGISTTGMSVNGTAVTNASAIIHASQDISRSTDTMEHKSNVGETVGFTTFNQSSDLSIECYPTGSSITNAATLRDALPKPGARVTLVDTDTNIGTDWICTAASMKKSQSDKLSVSMTLKRFDGISTYTPVT